MALPWFRMYGEAVDDVKLKLLAFEDRWHYVAILCCKSQGIIEVSQPLLDRRMAVKLGLQKSDLDEVRRRLIEAGLIDNNWQPIAWSKRQYESDNSTKRVRKYRKNNRTGNVSVTFQKRFGNGPETEAETDKETDGFNTLASNEKISFSPEEGFKNLNGYVDKWEAAYPAINVKNEIQKAAAWLQANPKNRKSNYARFLVNWLSRSQDKAGRTHEIRKSIAERATDARKSYEAKFPQRLDDGEPVGEA